MSTFEQLKKGEREARRDIIISAARKLFGEKPFHNIGMRDIAAEAGVSPASIYRYFPNQDELFVETLIQEIRSIEKRFNQDVADGKTDLEEVAKTQIDYLLDNEATFQLMIHFMVNRNIKPETLEKYNEVQRFLFNMLDQVIDGSGSKEEIRILSHAYFASLTGVVMVFRNYPGRDKEEIRRHMHRLGSLISHRFKKDMETSA